MTSELEDKGAEVRTPPPAPTGDPAAVSTVLLLATAPAASGTGPAALLEWEGGTLLSRLAAQLASLGVTDLRVITRPAWEAAVARAVAGARVIASPGVAADLEIAAEVAAEPGAGLLVAAAEVLTQGEALAGLIKDPRVATGVLTGGGRLASPFAYRIRVRRGRVTSVSSPYHAVHRPTGSFLSLLKVAGADRLRLAAAAAGLAAIAADPPPEWRAELERKEGVWAMALQRAEREDEPEESPDAPDDEHLLEGFDDPDEAITRVELGPEDAARLRDRMAAAPEDAAALLSVALVRSGALVTTSHLRALYWARPLSPEGIAEAAGRIAGHDEDRVLLDSAVKRTDGFFTTFLVSPYSRYIARWCARRGYTPNQVTIVSMAIGVLAAAGFATGERWGLVAGAVLLQLAFTTDCVDGQLARYTRTFTKLGAWLDATLDRAKEYLAFAGLAIGASRSGDPVWLLACAAITLQTARHTSDFAFAFGQERAVETVEQPPLAQVEDAESRLAAERRARLAPGDAAVPAPAPPTSLPVRVLRRWRRIDDAPGVMWVKKVVAFPIGERFALISVTAALWSAHTTFVAVLVWGGVAALYTQAGRVLRSFTG